jgi:hypothetical protein
VNPTTTLGELFGALASGDLDLARENAANLADSICDGDTMPERFTLRITPDKMHAICCALATGLKEGE